MRHSVHGFLFGPLNKYEIKNINIYKKLIYIALLVAVYMTLEIRNLSEVDIMFSCQQNPEIPSLRTLNKDA